MLPWIADDIVQLLRELDVEPTVVDFDPPTIAIDFREVERVPLLSPVVKDGKYYDAAPLFSGRRKRTTGESRSCLLPALAITE